MLQEFPMFHGYCSFRNTSARTKDFANLCSEFPHVRSAFPKPDQVFVIRTFILFIDVELFTSYLLLFRFPCVFFMYSSIMYEISWEFILDVFLVFHVLSIDSNWWRISRGEKAQHRLQVESSGASRWEVGLNHQKSSYFPNVWCLNDLKSIQLTLSLNSKSLDIFFCWGFPRMRDTIQDGVDLIGCYPTSLHVFAGYDSGRTTDAES